MRSLPSPSKFRPLRVTALLLAASLWLAPAMRTFAADAITTSSTTTTRTSLLSSLLGLSSSSSSSSTSNSLSDRLNRSILGLPIGLAKTLGTTAVKAAKDAVSKHVSSN